MLDNSATPSNEPDAHVPRVFTRITHTVDSESVTLDNHRQLNTTAVLLVFIFVGLCIISAMIFFPVRYFMRRAAIKRRRQASWILRSGHWNMEPKQTNAHETRTGRSDTSSSFSTYPYPLSEHF